MTARDQHALEMDFAVARHDFAAAGEVASRVKQVLRQLGIESELVRRAAVATYEAEMNLVIHSNGGKVALRVEPERIVVEACDLGPGIPDIERAMREGYSTAPDEVREMGFGAGMGLPNMRRCSDSFTIHSSVGRGTTVIAVIYIAEPEP